MKIKTFVPLVALLCITCTKENNNGVLTANEGNNAIASQPADAIPLNDLGANLFREYMGGLYPGGSNVASGNYAVDLLQISSSIAPLDTFGKASANGKITFISLGASIGGKNMKALIKKTVNNPVTNPKLILVNCNEGGQYASLTSIANPADPYWLDVANVMKQQKISFRQVQVVYLETDDGLLTKKFPDRANLIKKKIEACARTIKKKCVNVKVLYLLGRTRTFNDEAGDAAVWNSEPSPYFFGWACKWAIEDQINGIVGTEYKGVKKVAPIMTWGFYEWADSLPRITDNFYWRKSETKDGLHSNDAGEDTLATRFQKFLLTDTYAKKWYAAQ